jgi:ABC-type amino acid transport substrate-binding protein
MKFIKSLILSFFVFFVLGLSLSAEVLVNDLNDIKKRGAIRHLGVYYARFNTGFGDGFSVDIIKGFAKEIGVKYEFVESSFSTIISDLTGKDPKTSSKTQIRGDVIETGFTVLEDRKKYVSFATPVFPTQVWFIASADLNISPIKPGLSLESDIARVKALLPGISVLGIKDTCVDPDLYSIREAGAFPIYFDGGVNDLAPAVIKNLAKAALLDVADTLVALEKWPGKIKVIGPISEKQYMAAAFRKDSNELKDAYEKYLLKIFKNGEYESIVRNYYPDVFLYYPDFFKNKITGN